MFFFLWFLLGGFFLGDVISGIEMGRGGGGAWGGGWCAAGERMGVYLHVVLDEVRLVSLLQLLLGGHLDRHRCVSLTKPPKMGHKLPLRRLLTVSR